MKSALIGWLCGTVTDLILCFIEQLVQTGTWPRSSDLMSDFASLQNYVEDDIPAYLLVRLETTSSEWLAISYVPDTAKVRDKVKNIALKEGIIFTVLTIVPSMDSDAVCKHPECTQACIGGLPIQRRYIRHIKGIIHTLVALTAVH